MMMMMMMMMAVAMSVVSPLIPPRTSPSAHTLHK